MSTADERASVAAIPCLLRAHLPDELQDCHLQDVTPHGNAVELSQQVLHRPALVVLAEHEEGIALGGQVLLRSQHLQEWPGSCAARFGDTQSVGWTGASACPGLATL